MSAKPRKKKKRNRELSGWFQGAVATLAGGVIWQLIGQYPLEPGRFAAQWFWIPLAGIIGLAATPPVRERFVRWFEHGSQPVRTGLTTLIPVSLAYFVIVFTLIPDGLPPPQTAQKGQEPRTPPKLVWMPTERIEMPQLPPVKSAKRASPPQRAIPERVEVPPDDDAPRAPKPPPTPPPTPLTLSRPTNLRVMGG
jgi:hypothetical protein